MKTVLNKSKLEELLREADNRTEDLVDDLLDEVKEKARELSPKLTGANALSIEVDKQNKTVGPTSKYGLFLELGTSKMSARPYLVPALNYVKKQLTKQRIFKTIYE